jgi:predicted CDP-diglyceride synthetase/phosphatidate cytidylyltransferase
VAETKTRITLGGDRSMAGKRTSHVRWLLVIRMFIVSAIAYLDRVNISIAGKRAVSLHDQILIKIRFL